MRDVVFMVRQARRYDELRYALRSLRNLPHGRVWVYGGRPDWLANVIHVPVAQGGIAHANTAAITAAIANNRALSDEFYWFHDDMYITAPVDEVPRLWRCTWPEWEQTVTGRHGPYGAAKTQATAQALEAFGKAAQYCYELHIPMVVDRDALHDMVAAVTTWNPDILRLAQKRSLYGNWVGYGGQKASDVKFRLLGKRSELPAGPFASSSDHSFDHSNAGVAVQNLFPDPGPYEQPKPRRVPDVVRLMAGHLGAR